MQSPVTGARGEISNVEEVLEKLKQFCDEKRCEAQLMDATMVFGEAHVQSALVHAKRAFDEERNSAKSLATEIMLYASGERQISLAIEKMGMNEGTREFCILLLGDINPDELVQHLGLERDDSVLEGDMENLKAFGVSKKEIESVPEDKVMDLVLERVAMVDLLK